ncbi:hypothetical protein K432DRAFT_404753 [Lepidopterella palustris CBS 459.81]|uniref:Uncharacterized protein n=1 Tax=Lepidopterella palustris CBS 459.81 TaxID=1314670 RepID=A0A8E2EAE9_9PEZI|nr:hypothetical protein K432DRAFT_404753 [Lepidopterella palustris CBS 459.81]
MASRSVLNGPSSAAKRSPETEPSQSAPATNLPVDAPHMPLENLVRSISYAKGEEPGAHASVKMIKEYSKQDGMHDEARMKYNQKIEMYDKPGFERRMPTLEEWDGDSGSSIKDYIGAFSPVYIEGWSPVDRRRNVREANAKQGGNDRQAGAPDSRAEERERPGYMDSVTGSNSDESEISFFAGGGRDMMPPPKIFPWVHGDPAGDLTSSSSSTNSDLHYSSGPPKPKLFSRQNRYFAGPMEVDPDGYLREPNWWNEWDDVNVDENDGIVPSERGPHSLNMDFNENFWDIFDSSTWCDSIQPGCNTIGEHAEGKRSIKMDKRSGGNGEADAREGEEVEIKTKRDDDEGAEQVIVDDYEQAFHVEEVEYDASIEDYTEKGREDEGFGVRSKDEVSVEEREKGLLWQFYSYDEDDYAEDYMDSQHWPGRADKGQEDKGLKAEQQKVQATEVDQLKVEHVEELDNAEKAMVQKRDRTLLAENKILNPNHIHHIPLRSRETGHETDSFHFANANVYEAGLPPPPELLPTSSTLDMLVPTHDYTHTVVVQYVHPSPSTDAATLPLSQAVYAYHSSLTTIYTPDDGSSRTGTPVNTSIVVTTKGESGPTNTMTIGEEPTGQITEGSDQSSPRWLSFGALVTAVAASFAALGVCAYAVSITMNRARKAQRSRRERSRCDRGRRERSEERVRAFLKGEGSE